MSKHKTQAHKFVELFYHWCGRLKFTQIIHAEKDNRMNCGCAITDWDNDNICLRYNTKRLGKRQDFELLCDVFHEIGHLINNLPYDTEAQQIKSERMAERFALRMMRKYYKKEYKQLLKYMKEKQTLLKLKKKDPLYYKAFIKIRVYRNTIKE